MTVKLMTYTKINYPPSPFEDTICAGVVEKDSERQIVRIDTDQYDNLTLGMEGEIEERETENGNFRFFIPK